MTTPPALWLVRHGETSWSRAHRHTGRTDVPLTSLGELHASALAARLGTIPFALVLASPLTRARATAELAGFAERVELDADLVELDYGAYEGRTSAEIHAERPGWDLWRDGGPGGETIAAAARRADRVLARVREADGPVLLVGHGHFSRILTARALGHEPELGRHLTLDPTAVSHLGTEHGAPAIQLWNDVSHLAPGGGG